MALDRLAGFSCSPMLSRGSSTRHTSSEARPEQPLPRAPDDSPDPTALNVKGMAPELNDGESPTPTKAHESQ